MCGVYPPKNPDSSHMLPGAVVLVTADEGPGRQQLVEAAGKEKYSPAPATPHTGNFTWVVLIWSGETAGSRRTGLCLARRILCVKV